MRRKTPDQCVKVLPMLKDEDRCVPSVCGRWTTLVFRLFCFYFVFFFNSMAAAEFNVMPMCLRYAAS